jgi:hypothetical protein
VQTHRNCVGSTHWATGYGWAGCRLLTRSEAPVIQNSKRSIVMHTPFSRSVHRLRDLTERGRTLHAILQVGTPALLSDRESRIQYPVGGNQVYPSTQVPGKRVWKLSAGRSLAPIVLLGLPSAKADLVYDFSVNLTGGFAPGTVTGTIDLPLVSPSGSGSGEASSLVLTPFPAGIGTLSSNTVTSWAHQLADAFTVTSRAVTSYYFAADTLGAPTADFSK